MSRWTRPDAAVVICTFNRAARLGETLDSLATTSAAAPLEWECLVVDNKSPDATRDVVAARAGAFPVPLRYLYEPQQGKSYALNTGIAASSARVIVFTDDDVRLTPAWLAAGCAPLLAATGIAYTGGPVRPIWGAPRPHWLSGTRGDLWGTIAIADYGAEPFIFEERQKIPLGVNMAVRRDLIERIGGFRPELGRTGTSLLGQEQAEFFLRSRLAGARGQYVPEMELAHHVPAARLTRAYFRRWWLWKGISRARLASMHSQTDLGIDLPHVRHFLDVPRFMYGGALRDLGRWLGKLGGPADERFAHEMMLRYFAGYFCGRQRWTRIGAANRLHAGGTAPAIAPVEPLEPPLAAASGGTSR